MTGDEKFAVAKKIIEVMKNAGVTDSDLYTVETFVRELQREEFPPEPYQPALSRMEIVNTAPVKVHLS